MSIISIVYFTTQQSFLNTNNVSNYLFSFLESKNTNQAKIFFQNKEWKMPKNKSGYIVINKEDFAVLEIEITSTQNPLYKKDMK